jgi:adenine C2-methylase RlmN of 23S rRNA A2503 and tRNA A37
MFSLLNFPHFLNQSFKIKKEKITFLFSGKITEQIEVLKDQSWQVIQPRKLRASLDQLREQMKTFPARLRQYASYEHTMNKLKSMIKSNWIVVELKSSTVKERHWKQLIKKLRVNWNLQELILGKCSKKTLNIFPQFSKTNQNVKERKVSPPNCSIFYLLSNYFIFFIIF